MSDQLCSALSLGLHGSVRANKVAPDEERLEEAEIMGQMSYVMSHLIFGVVQSFIVHGQVARAGGSGYDVKWHDPAHVIVVGISSNSRENAQRN